MFDLLDYIPFGKENAISRGELASLTGLRDRVLREEISRLKRYHVIINLGSGYYRTDNKDEIRQYVKQETARMRSIGWSLWAARKAIGGKCERNEGDNPQ